MQVEEPIEGTEGAQQSSWALAIEMLRGVLEGGTYDAVAARHGITRTAVERRIKAVAIHVASTAGISGLNAQGAAFVRRHIIRVTDKAFDDFAAGGADEAANRRMLGLGRGSGR